MHITSDIFLLGEDLLVGIESCKQFFLAIFDFSGIGLEIEESSKKKTCIRFLIERKREKKELVTHFLLRISKVRAPAKRL